MERHRRVHRLRRVLRIVQRHFHRRARPVHVKAHGVRALEGIAVDADGVRRRIIRSRREALRRVVGKGNARVGGVPVMDRNRRVDLLRRILRIVQRHLDGRAHAVRRKALRVGIGVGVALHLRLVDGGIGLHVCLCLRSGVTGDLLAGLRVHMMGRHRRVHHLRRAGRVVQRHLDGRAHAVHGKGVGAGV